MGNGFVSGQRGALRAGRGSSGHFGGSSAGTAGPGPQASAPRGWGVALACRPGLSGLRHSVEPGCECRTGKWGDQGSEPGGTGLCWGSAFASGKWGNRRTFPGANGRRESCHVIDGRA